MDKPQIVAWASPTKLHSQGFWERWAVPTLPGIAVSVTNESIDADLAEEYASTHEEE